MKNSLLKKFRQTFEQAFVPIFVKDEFDTEVLLAGCELAGVSVLEYTLRRPDAHEVIPTLKNRYPDYVIYVGSTVDSDAIMAQMREKHPQLLTIAELTPFVDGLVSMLPYSDETLEKYRATHLMIPTAETSGEALRQMSHGATVIKVCGPDFSFSKKLHAAPTFNYCPTFVTGGVNNERMEEAYAAGNILTAAGFDLILKGEDPATLTPEKVAEKLTVYLTAAEEARAKVMPWTKNSEALSDEAFLAAFPHYCSVREV